MNINIVPRFCLQPLGDKYLNIINDTRVRTETARFHIVYTTFVYSFRICFFLKYLRWFALAFFPRLSGNTVRRKRELLAENSSKYAPLNYNAESEQLTPFSWMQFGTEIFKCIMNNANFMQQFNLCTYLNNSIFPVCDFRNPCKFQI